MGDIFSSHSDSQATTTQNQQVGVQGGIGQSGTITGSQAAGGSIGIGNTAGNLSIQVVDAGALHAAETIAASSIGSNRDVSLQSINAAQMVASNALVALQNGNALASKSASDATAAAERIALTATPASANETLATYAGGQAKSLIIIGLSIAAVFIIPKLIKA